MRNSAEIAKFQAPPGMYHASNDGNSLTEKEAGDTYFEFYHRHIPRDEFTILRHDKMAGCWVILVPIKYKDICEIKEAQIRARLDMLNEITDKKR